MQESLQQFTKLSWWMTFVANQPVLELLAISGSLNKSTEVAHSHEWLKLIHDKFQAIMSNATFNWNRLKAVVINDSLASLIRHNQVRLLKLAAFCLHTCLRTNVPLPD